MNQNTIGVFPILYLKLDYLDVEKQKFLYLNSQPIDPGQES